MPLSKSTRRARGPVGPPISYDMHMEDAGLSGIHYDIAQSFAEAARELQEELLNKKGLRQRWFTLQDFREMAIRWTDTLEKMHFIPGINTEKVDRYGGKFLPLIRTFQQQYKDMMGTPVPTTTTATTAGPSGHNVVDLVSSDDDGGDADQEVEEYDDENIADDVVGGETSAYFGAGVIPAQPSARAREFHDALARMEQAAAAPQGSRGRSKSSASRSRSGFAKGKRSYARRTSGGGGSSSRGGRSGGGAAAGVRKRATAATGSSGSARTASGPFGGGSRGSKGGKGGGDGGGGGGGSGIGLMKY